MTFASPSANSHYNIRVTFNVAHYLRPQQQNYTRNINPISETKTEYLPVSNSVLSVTWSTGSTADGTAAVPYDTYEYILLQRGLL